MTHNIQGCAMLEAIEKDIQESWDAFLTPFVVQELIDIESKIGNDYTPSTDKVLRFLTTELDEKKICILGQDPYPAKGVATGRSFEVGGLKDWATGFRQTSVKNIVRLIHKSYVTNAAEENVKDFNEIRKEIRAGDFQILPPNLLFDSLEKQGVLFLNTYLTCEVGKANSHREVWKGFSEKLLGYISAKRPDLTWFLWGGEAQEAKTFLSSGNYVECSHPASRHTTADNYFLKSNCFRDTMDIVNWMGV